jgi:hypothetical protein
MKAFLKAWFTERLGLKAISIALAVVVWFYVDRLVTRPKDVADVVIHMEAPARMKFVVNGQMKDGIDVPVTVTVRGPQAEIDRLRSLHGSVDAPALGSQPGQRRVVFERKHLLDLPPSAAEVHFQPAWTDVTLAATEVRRHPVRADLKPEPPEDLRVEERRPPPTVEVTMTREDAEKVPPNQPVFTEPMELPRWARGEWTSGPTAIRPYFMSGDEKVPFVCAEKAAVTFTIRPATLATREVANVPVRIVRPPNFGRAVTLEPPAVVLTVTSDAETYQKLNRAPEAITAFVDVADLASEKAGTFPRKVKVFLPPGAELAPPEPACQVRLGAADSAPRPEDSERTLTGVPVSLLAPPALDGRLVTLETDSVNVDLRGPKDALAKLTPADVLAFVDVRGRVGGAEAGRFQEKVLVLVNGQQGITVASKPEVWVKVAKAGDGVKTTP